MSKATDIVDAILADMTDRRGLRHEWDQIDDDIKQEIKTTWAEIVQSELDKK
jgi:hypothetical protein